MKRSGSEAREALQEIIGYADSNEGDNVRGQGPSCIRDESHEFGGGQPSALNANGERQPLVLQRLLIFR